MRCCREGPADDFRHMPTPRARTLEWDVTPFQPRFDRWLSLAGLLTWAVAGLPTVVRLVEEGPSFATLGKAVAWLGFGAGFWLVAGDRPRPLSRRQHQIVFAFQTA